MKCKQCSGELAGKKANAKFCSNTCRSLYSKNNGGNKPLNAIQWQVMYNTIMDAVEKVNDRLDKMGVYLANNQRIMPNISATAPAQAFNGTIRKSVEQYITEKREILQESDWITLKEEINKDENLTAKQKLLIFTS